MIHRITSRSNPRLKDFIKNRDQYYIFQGEKLVRDILARQIPLERLVMHQDHEGDLDVGSLNVKETWYVNDNVMAKISTLKEKPGFVAVLGDIQKGIDFANSQVVIGLDSIQDPGNAGTIFRCAAAFGIHGVAFCGDCVRPNNSKLLRAAQTAVLDTGFQVYPHSESLINAAFAAGFRVYLTAADPGGQSVEPGDVRLPCLVLLGNEGQGLPRELFRRLESIGIPQHNKVESLNVGVSACIIMHELRKKF